MANSKSMKQTVIDTAVNNKVGGGIGMAAVCLVAAGVLARNRRSAAKSDRVAPDPRT